MPNDPTGTPGTGFPRSPSWTVTIVIALCFRSDRWTARVLFPLTQALFSLAFPERSAMAAASISCLFPAQDTVALTLSTLSRIRDRTRGLRAEIILIDRPSVLDLCREIPRDVLVVRT